MLTQRVRPAPNPPQRSLVPLVLPNDNNIQNNGRFTVLTYNLLADLYGKVRRSRVAVGSWPFAHTQRSAHASFDC